MSAKLTLPGRLQINAHAGRQLGAVEQNSVGAADASPGAYDGIEVFNFVCGKLFAGYGG